MSTLKDQVKAHLEKLGASPKRSLGQNFLVSEVIIDKIVTATARFEPKHLIEIGPGLGALTTHLKELSHNLQLIELDRSFAENWRAQGFHVIEEDALKVDWSQFSSEEYCLVSNLPYQISSSLVVDRSVEPHGIEAMVLMFQKEVAQRLKADPKNKAYGLLTVISQAAWDISQVCDAGPREFFPPPNVASRVLKFKKNRKFSGDWDFFLQVLKAGFAHRRKYLLSNLNSVILAQGIEKQDAQSLLAEFGHKETVRAEELSVDQWIQLTEFLGRKKEI